MSKHSEGPWTAKTGRNSWGGILPPLVVGPKGQRLATVQAAEDDHIYTADGNDFDEDAEIARDEANARLMAASLDLLERLRAHVEMCPCSYDCEVCKADLAAIAKATNGEGVPDVPDTDRDRPAR